MEFLGTFGLLLLLILYLVPSFSAYYLKHHNAGAITLLNVVAGWTGIGWLAALIWSFTNPKKVVVVNQSKSQSSIQPENQTLKVKLTELQELKLEGLITEQEYSERRANLLKT